MRRGGWIAGLGLALVLVAAAPALAQGSSQEWTDDDYAVEEATDVWVSWDHPPDEDGGKEPIDETRSLAAEASAGVIVGNDRSEPIDNVTLAFVETPAGIDAELGKTRAGAASPDRAAFWPRIQPDDFGPVIASIEMGSEVERGELRALVVFETADGSRHAAMDTLTLEREHPRSAPAPGALAATGLLLAVSATARRRA